ncbi:MarR family winged helix-turn-helix transcriptional regulator, partial [Burkholderia cenocepacia]|uniref:MarR family winged helix-turn-helix transcriptional regulator n=1 Tax=Burkholderia cenocepacia TaxID=95486 RepID=UPI0024B78C03
TPSPAAPKLSEFLCFAIYSANLAFGKAYKPILDELGLTYTQYITIIALWEQDNQTVGQLGEKLFLESNTLTPILKKLEAMGYLERHRDPSDERQVLVSLTKTQELGQLRRGGRRGFGRFHGLPPATRTVADNRIIYRMRSYRKHDNRSRSADARRPRSA